LLSILVCIIAAILPDDAVISVAEYNATEIEVALKTGHRPLSPKACQMFCNVVYM